MAAKKVAQKKAAAATEKRGGKSVAASSAKNNGASTAASEKLEIEVSAMSRSDRNCIGVLSSLPMSTDIHISSLSVTFHGHDLIVDSKLELNNGRRYGLLGPNGCGKSTLLTAIGMQELPIPDHMNIYHLTREIEASDMFSLEAVVNCDDERMKLEAEAEGAGADVMEIIYERLEA